MPEKLGNYSFNEQHLKAERLLLEIAQNTPNAIADTQRIMAIMKATSDQNRLHILHLLTDGPRTGAQINQYLGITQPTLSHHMKALLATQLVYEEKAGTSRLYSLNPEAIRSIGLFWLSVADRMQAMNQKKPELI